MPAAQEGLKFLFEIQDKITANLIRLEKKAKASAGKIDKAFTKASKSQEVNTARIVAIEQRRVAAAQSNSAKLAAIEQRRVAAVQSSTAKIAAIDQKRVAAVQSNSTKLTAIYRATASKAAAIEQKRMVAVQKTTERAVALAKRESDARTKSAAKSATAEQRRIAGVEKAHAKSIKLLKSQSDAFKRSMTRLASASAVAFAAVAGKAIQMAGGYDLAMRSVQAKTGATGELMDRLREQSREMGRTTVHSATEAARGQAFLAQAGFDANEVLAALPGTLNLATAGELGLAEAADIASNVLTGFNLNISESDRVADVLALTAQSTNTNVQQMGDAMKYAAAVAAAADADFEETAAAIGLLAMAGFQGETGGTALRGSMSKLLNPTKAAQKVLDKLGISAVTSTGGLKPLHAIVGQFEDVGLTAGDAMKIFGQRAGPGMLALVSQGSDALVDLTGELKNAEGTAQKTADIMGGGLWGAIKKIQSIVESAYISLGERFAPAVEWVANLFAKLPAPVQEVVVVVGSLVGAMGGLMLIAPGSFGAIVQFPGKLIALARSIKGVTAVQWLMNAAMTANPIGLVVAAVALLAGGLYLLFTKTEIGREAFEAIGHVAKFVFTTAINGARVAIKWLAKWAVKAKDKIVEMIPKWVSKAVEWLGKKVADVTGKIKAFNDNMKANAKIAAMYAKKQEALAEATDATAEVTEEVAEAVAEATEAAEDSSKAVQALTDSWTGATLKSGEFLAAFQELTPAQKDNDRIMDQVLTKYESMRKVLGPFNDELEKIRRSTQRWTPALSGLNEEQNKSAHSAAAAGEGIDALNIEVQAIGISQDAWDVVLQSSNESLEDQLDAFAESKKRASGYGLALAGLSGQMGGATDQNLNLIIAMSEHNKEQKAAAALGKKTEGSFGKMRLGAAGLATGFSALGDMVGGVAGKVLTEISGIAKAFATGGLVAGIIAGVMSLGKAIWGLFTRGKRKREAAAKKEAAAAKIVADAAKAAADTHAEAVEGLRRAWLSIPTDQIVLDLTAIREAWDALGVEDRTVAFDDYVDSLISARDAGAELTAAELNLVTLFDEYEGKRTAMLARHKAEMDGFDTQIAALESLLGTKISEVDALIAQQKSELSALSARQDAEIAALASRRAAALSAMSARQDAEMSAMLSRQQAEMSGFDTQIDALESRLHPKISELNALLDQQKAELDAISARQDAEIAALATRRKAALDSISARQTAEMSAMLARQQAEMSGFDTQIDALESRLYPKISELQMLLDTQKAELDALSARQDTEMAALATRRKAALDSIMAVQNEQLALLKETQSKELAEMKAAQEAELSALEAARNAQLSVVESAIQRELEDERIAAQLTIDLRKAGSDQEAIDAAHARASTSTERLLERDELNDLMAEAERRLRAGYADELYTINAHWDERRRITTESYAEEFKDLESLGKAKIEAVEQMNAEEVRVHNDFWDDLEQRMGERQATELTALGTAHTEQLQALLDSLTLRRDAREAAHALEKTTLETKHARLRAGRNTTTYFDALEELMTLRHAAELTALEASHKAQLEALLASLKLRKAAREAAHALEKTTLETKHAAELQKHNDYFDDLEELMTLRHGVELEMLKEAHRLQLEALLASLTLRRDTLTNSHATELADLDNFHDAKIRAILAAQVAERDARRNAGREAQRPIDDAEHQHEYFERWDHDPLHTGDYHEHEDFDYRQHGGPVSAGQPATSWAKAGLRCSFRRSRGRIEPHGSSSGGASAKDLARAVAESLEGMAVNVDGRKLGRLTIRHQPLAIAELGGRR